MRRSLPFVAAVLLAAARAASAQAGGDARDEWEVRPGFSLQVDATGFEMPSAIAFVPRPGPGPKDPLYFVTELRGRVKVVTNDRSVLVFADSITHVQPAAELPSGLGEHGTAGICLDPAHGWVFVTSAYIDSAGALRNKVVRLESVPGTFSTASRGRVEFREIFAAHPSVNSHQIGPCQVDGDHLYVGVGDALTAVLAQFPGSPNGKILRMSLDGRPVTSNPLRVDDDVRKPENYIWAMGFRNPFGLEMVDGRVFVADNGLNVDRFLEIERGGNYMWDGNDWSIGTNALVTFGPSVSPVQTEYLPSSSSLYPPEYRDRFYVATAGLTERAGPGLVGDKSVLTLNLDLARRRMRGRPEAFARFRGSGNQVLAALGIGPDGVYFAPMLPAADGSTPVLKVVHDPASEHRHIIGRSSDPRVLIAEKRCLGCHQLDEVPGGTLGPPLHRTELAHRLRTALSASPYEDSLRALDALAMEPVSKWTEARRRVAAASGDERVRLWLEYRLQEPRFDSPNAMMPNLGVTPSEASVIAGFLLEAPAPPEEVGPFLRLKRALGSRLPPPRHTYTVLAFLLGLGVPLFALVIQRSRRRR